MGQALQREHIPERQQSMVERQQSMVERQQSIVERQQTLLERQQTLLEEAHRQLQAQGIRTIQTLPQEQTGTAYSSPTNHSLLLSLPTSLNPTTFSPTHDVCRDIDTDYQDNDDTNDSDSDSRLSWPRHSNGKELHISRIQKSHVLTFLKHQVSNSSDTGHQFANLDNYVEKIYRHTSKTSKSICTSTDTQQPYASCTGLASSSKNLERQIEQQINTKYQFRVDKAENHWFSQYFIYCSIANARRADRSQQQNVTIRQVKERDDGSKNIDRSLTIPSKRKSSSVEESQPSLSSRESGRGSGSGQEQVESNSVPQPKRRTMVPKLVCEDNA